MTSKNKKYTIWVDQFWEKSSSPERVINGEFNHQDLESVALSLASICRENEVPPAVTAASELICRLLEASKARGGSRIRMREVWNVLNLGRYAQDTSIRNAIVVDTVRKLERQGMGYTEARELVAGIIGKSFDTVENAVLKGKEIPDSGREWPVDLLIERLKRYK